MKLSEGVPGSDGLRRHPVKVEIAGSTPVGTAFLFGGVGGLAPEEEALG